MNLAALKKAEKNFLSLYPGGFAHPEMLEIGKRHKVDQLSKFAKESFSKPDFDNSDFIISGIVKLVARSSMISMFEKPKFRDMAKILRKGDKKLLVESTYELLHGKEKVGFEALVSLLTRKKMARWPIATVIQSYFRPQRDIFIKPTTTKLIIECLELDLEYKPAPTWEFYSKYRKTIKEIKTKVNKNLAPNNAAFCGFLMMSLGEKK